MSERKPKAQALATLDEWIAKGWQLRIYSIYDPAWPVNGEGWRAELIWQNGNTVSASMPSYADAIELLAGEYRP